MWLNSDILAFDHRVKYTRKLFYLDAYIGWLESGFLFQKPNKILSSSFYKKGKWEIQSETEIVL